MLAPFILCFSEKSKSENEKIIEKKCKHDKIMGDEICDDDANVFECDFDGGDCCGADSIKDFCLQCQCYSKYWKRLKYSLK